jgi:hypothetical protein
MARNQPRKQVDTLGQSDCGQQASPRSSARLSQRRCISKAHQDCKDRVWDNPAVIHRGLVGRVPMQRDRGLLMSEPKCPKCDVPMRLMRVVPSILPPETGVECRATIKVRQQRQSG